MGYKKRSKTFHFEEDGFSRNAQIIGKIYHEVVILIKFLQAKLQVKNMNNKFMV